MRLLFKNKCTEKKHDVDDKDILQQIHALKIEVDFILKQLSENDYLSVEVFANNIVYMSRIYEVIQERMSDNYIMQMMIRTDLLLAVDLLAIGQMINLMNNFLRCSDSKIIR